MTPCWSESLRCSYLADGFYENWLGTLERAKRDLPLDAVLFMGHGEPAIGHALLDWQASYIHLLLGAIRTGSERDGLNGEALTEVVTAQMKAFLPSEDLLFLMRLCVLPLRDQLVQSKR